MKTMKKIFLFLSATFTLTSAFAQAKAITSTTFDKASLAAHEITIEAPADIVIDLWDDYWDDRYDVDIDREDRNREREVYNAKGVTVEAISEKQVDVYSKVAEIDDNTSKVSLGIGLGYDVYASADNFSSSYNTAGEILSAFEPYFYQKYYGEKLSGLKEQLEDARDEKSDLESDLEKSNRRIERWEEDIVKLREDIEKERKEISEARSSMTEQTTKVQQLESDVREMEQLFSRWKQ